jgi:hypothetical protein
LIGVARVGRTALLLFVVCLGVAGVVPPAAADHCNSGDIHVRDGAPCVEPIPDMPDDPAPTPRPPAPPGDVCVIQPWRCGDFIEDPKGWIWDGVRPNSCIGLSDLSGLGCVVSDPGVSVDALSGER